MCHPHWQLGTMLGGLPFSRAMWQLTQRWDSASLLTPLRLFRSLSQVTASQSNTDLVRGCPGECGLAQATGPDCGLSGTHLV